MVLDWTNYVKSARDHTTTPNSDQIKLLFVDSISIVILRI
jgi:hypothetical protein